MTKAGQLPIQSREKLSQEDFLMATSKGLFYTRKSLSEKASAYCIIIFVGRMSPYTAFVLYYYYYYYCVWSFTTNTRIILILHTNCRKCCSTPLLQPRLRFEMKSYTHRNNLLATTLPQSLTYHFIRCICQLVRDWLCITEYLLVYSSWLCSSEYSLVYSSKDKALHFIS